MAWTSWLRIWAKRKTTTTTGRKPLRCSSKILRWKRMYLLLRADQRLKQNHEDVLLPAHLQNCTYQWKILDWYWARKLFVYRLPSVKTTEYSSRHGHLPWEDDGAIEFWRLQDYLLNHFVQSQHWSDEMWKSTMAKGGGNKKIFQHCTDPSGQEILFSKLFKVIQDEHTSHVTFSHVP